MTQLIFNSIDIQPLLKAKDFLQSAIQSAQNEFEVAGAIQAFEICYELSWKMMKRILAYRGVEINSPREAFRAAAKEKLIQEPEVWFDFLKNRNLTVHTYNLNVAQQIFQSLPKFMQELNQFVLTIQAL